MISLPIDEVLPALIKIFERPVILHRTLLTSGIGESFLAERISEFEQALPEHIKLAYLPHYGMVRLRLSASSYDAELLTKEVDDQFNNLQLQLSDVLVTNKDESLADH